MLRKLAKGFKHSNVLKNSKGVKTLGFVLAVGSYNYNTWRDIKERKLGDIKQELDDIDHKFFIRTFKTGIYGDIDLKTKSDEKTTRLIERILTDPSFMEKEIPYLKFHSDYDLFLRQFNSIVQKNLIYANEYYYIPKSDFFRLKQMIRDINYYFLNIPNGKESEVYHQVHKKFFSSVDRESYEKLIEILFNNEEHEDIALKSFLENLKRIK